jgi:hypothetical protein
MSEFMSSSVIKPAAAAATVFLIDKYYFRTYDQKQSIYLAAAVGGSTFIAGVLDSQGMVPAAPDMGFSTYASGKGISRRLTEIALSSGAGYLTSSYILNSKWDSNEMMKRIAAIAAANIVAESVSDWWVEGRVNYFDA